MNIEPRTLKGFREFLPEEARKRQYVIQALKKVFEFYGFEPLETPALEYEDILLGKYGDEGDKLMYRFTDNGERKVAMRYDQTVPLARVVAQFQNELPLPFKRYQVSNVWRAENTQKGRFREFLQCDIDTVGVDSALADSEIIQVVIFCLESLGVKNFKVLVNDRSVFEGISKEAITIIDKLKKIGVEEIKKELTEKNLDTALLDKVTSSKPTLRIQEVTKILSDNRVIFEPTLARGLDYYTGLIIEVEIEGYTAGSVGGGGRYDNLIGMFGSNNIPAVGFSFGFDRLIEALEQLNLIKITPSVTKALVTVFSKELEKDSIELASKLRGKRITTEVWLDTDFRMEKQIKYAVKKKIPYLIIIGPEEKEKNVITIKALDTREQKTVKIEEAIQMIG
ncbi:MAG: histidine--tRNA ligase [Candidatus Levyibacteriota bacterium]